MIISTIFRNRTTQKILRVVVPLAFWLGAWQLAAIWVDTVYTPGHGALLLPSPLLVWERLAALGCRLYQGYLYSPALPLDEFMAFAAKYTAVQPAAGREKQPAGME